MKICLITPAPKHSRSGNRTTAARWASLLKDLGHHVRIAVDYDDDQADLMVALHAWRSAASIERFRARYPEQPLIVALTGTDIYQYIKTDPKTTLRSLALADALVGLHELVHCAIPECYHDKLSVIYQSATPLGRQLAPLQRTFQVLVVGHLRDVKDPFRAAAAARQLPASSRIRIVHLGRAGEAEWAERARAEMRENPRYDWRADVPGWMVRKMLARSRLMVLTSIMEGGANVISEAVVSGIPVIASSIPGSVGLLGGDYPGYFPAGDTAALAGLMLGAEQDPGFLHRLQRHCAARARLFEPAQERDSWRRLLERFTTSVARS